MSHLFRSSLDFEPEKAVGFRFSSSDRDVAVASAYHYSLRIQSLENVYCTDKISGALTVTDWGSHMIPRQCFTPRGIFPALLLQGDSNSICPLLSTSLWSAMFIYVNG